MDFATHGRNVRGAMLYAPGRIPVRYECLDCHSHIVEDAFHGRCTNCASENVRNVDPSAGDHRMAAYEIDAAPSSGDHRMAAEEIDAEAGTD